jgi:hypothetical protein
MGNEIDGRSEEFLPQKRQDAEKKEGEELE